MKYVYTVIGNGWDNLRPPACEQREGVRFICFTDVPNLPNVEGWEYRPLHPAGAACRTSRVPKILPHLMLPDDAEYSIYHDGNLQLSQDPGRVISNLLSTADWAVHRHPARQCIFAEARILLNEKIGTPALVRAEIERYSEAGHPVAEGLWANGFIVRRHTPDVARLNELWWAMYAAGCERDQLSFPVARRTLGTKIFTIDADVYNSPYLNYYWHAAWKDRATSIEFHPERARIREKLARLHSLTGTVSPYPEY